MSKPLAVCISDVHYNLNTLEVADAAMRLAINHANRLDVPLIVCGDLHDTMANLRADCVFAMLKTFAICKTVPYVLVGNHDKINEKSKDNALGFLSRHVELIDKPARRFGIEFIPYQYDLDVLRAHLTTLRKDCIIIMHQGVKGKPAGDYIVDHSALDVSDLAGHRVISGHYHTRQQFELPEGGLMDYIGNPYTLTYGEANDPVKGYQVLMDDGSLEFVPTNLRNHVVFEHDCEGLDIWLNTGKLPDAQDLVWLKIKDVKANLTGLTKEMLSRYFKQPVKLDLIPTDTQAQPDAQPDLTGGPLLDALIDSLSGTTTSTKDRLKDLWRALK